MKHKTFFWFVLPTSIAMLLFIALPIVSVVLQSMYAPHEQVIIEVENCDVFGCKKSTMVDQDATRELREAKPWVVLLVPISIPIAVTSQHLKSQIPGVIQTGSKISLKRS